MRFTVIGIEKVVDSFIKNSTETAKIEMEAKHPETFYRSTIFLRVPWADRHDYQIDSTHDLIRSADTENPPLMGDLPTLQEVK